jgi:hypothetical protein
MLVGLSYTGRVNPLPVADDVEHTLDQAIASVKNVERPLDSYPITRKCVRA